jgi:hypothetical protein
MSISVGLGAFFGFDDDGSFADGWAGVGASCECEWCTPSPCPPQLPPSPCEWP